MPRKDSGSAAPTISKEQIIEYFETCEKGYRQVWDLERSQAMHYGFWDDGVRSLPDALRRENEVLCQRAGITSDDRVLDAGCGVGGSSLFLARHVGCEVVGITLSEHQANTATRFAMQHEIEGVRFEAMDYEATSFDDESFSVVWGLESICYAGDKQAFLEEAWRLLRPGGRLIMADGFATKPLDTYDPEDAHLMVKWLKGWAIPPIETGQKYLDQARKAGFCNVVFEDVTPLVRRSARRIFWLSLVAIPKGLIENLFGRVSQAQMDHSMAAFLQMKALRRGLWQYGILYAEKPAQPGISTNGSHR